MTTSELIAFCTEKVQRPFLVIGGLALGAIIATRPRGYVVYEGYGQPVYGPGCYWASQPIYDRAGRIVGYSGQPVQVCPGYQPR